MSLISEELSSNYKISISIYSTGTDNLPKTKIEVFDRNLKLNSTQLQDIVKYLKVVANTVEEHF